MEIKTLKEKLMRFQRENISYFDEIKGLVADMKKEVQLISYFSYSLNLAQSPGQENIVIGSYHIQNLGLSPIINPYICIKLSEESPFQFLGKYQNKNSAHLSNTIGAWERINDPADKEEYWLKPSETSVLRPSEKLSFPNFQIKWTAKNAYRGKVMGFTYSDERKEGTAAINQISISGLTPQEGEN